MLEFECSACDDLQDDWHKKDQNRNKIIAFVRDSGIDFRVLDGKLLPFEKSSFDMVMLHDVLEHLHDSPRNLLNDLLELVKPNGKLFVTVPNAVNIRKRVKVLLGQTNMPPFEFYYWYPDPWRGHIREYTKGDLIKLCQFLGLDVLDLRCVDHLAKTKMSAVAWPLYVAITGVVPDTKNSWSLVAKKNSGWNPRRSLLEDDLGKILGRATTYGY